MEDNMGKNKLTMDDYIRAGALCRMCHYMLGQLWSSPAIARNEQNVAQTANKKLDTIRGRTEDKMFKDFPDIEHGLDVFYGGTDNEPYSETDAEVIKMMRQIICEMLGDNVHFLGA